MAMRWNRDNPAENPAVGQQQQSNSQKRQLSGSKISTSYTNQFKKQVQASSQANNIDPLATKQYMQNYLTEHPVHQGSATQLPMKVIKQGAQQLGQTQIQPNSQMKANYTSSTGALTNTAPGPLNGQLTQLSGGGSMLKMAQEIKPPSRNSINRNAQNASNSGVEMSKTQAVSHGNLQALPSNQKASTHGVGEIPTFDRRKDRTGSSSSKQKLNATTGQLQNELPQGSLSRSLVRPSSKQRQANPSGTEAGREKVYAMKQPMPTNGGRGSSPGTNLSKPVNNLNVAGTNLQNYFDNQIPQYQVGSSKNLPRKKRIVKDQNVQGATQPGQEINGENRSNSRQNINNQMGGLPPMGQTTSTTNILSQHQQQQQKAISPIRNTTQNIAKPAVQRPQPMPNTQTAQQSSYHQSAQQPSTQVPVKPKAPLARPSAPQHIPLPFEDQELFLNVESQYNSLLMQMIQPNRDNFEFNGTIQYVMNASELSNQNLAKLLFERKAFNHNMLQKNRERNSRSRNVTDGSLNKQGAAGQSTSSFFNAKKNFSAATFQQASTVESSIQSVEGIEIGGEVSFFDTLRQELTLCNDSHIKGMMPDYQPAKYSAKRNGIVAAYGANTNQGIVRNYNEDRVAIILNIMKPKSKQYTGEEWPKCSFFGIYDGHGGNVCADFLRDYLHQFIIKDSHFPKEPIKAIREGFKEAEKLFLEFAEGQQFEVGDIDRSGSCAIVALIIDDMCYIGNTGDSRACMSVDGGKQVWGLSNDHKPTDEVEMERILGNNGRIYQNSSIVNVQQPIGGLQSQVVLGPHRVFPGRLSVCRTFGDIEAKLPKLDGNPKVVIADPDVMAFKIDRDHHDFIVIGCDGIFDKMENRDCIHFPWQAVLADEMMKSSNSSFSNPLDEEAKGNTKQGKAQDERRHKLAGLTVDAILKASAVRRSCDNITTVVIVFDNFYRMLDKLQGKSLHSNDREIFEEVELQPVQDSLTEVSNVIYIENEELLESADESTAVTGGENNLKNQQDASKASNRYQQNNAQNHSAGVVLFGDTGAGDHSFPSTIPAMANQAGYPKAAGTESAYLNADQILSEIAEEDSVSMLSDRPKRLGQKASEAYTPKDPITNSFIGSIRVSTTNLNGKLEEKKDEPPQESKNNITVSSSKLTQEQKEEQLDVEPYKAIEDDVIVINSAKTQKQNIQHVLEAHNQLSSGSGSNTAQPFNQKSRQQRSNYEHDAQNILNTQGLPPGSKANTYSHPVQPTIGGIQSNLIQPVKQGNTIIANAANDLNSAMFPAKKRRNSNQGIQRANYNTSATQQHQSMPPQSQTSLAPLSSNPNLQGNMGPQLQGQKGIVQQSRSQSNGRASEAASKKSKTQQPGKLIEIFRQVDNHVIGSNTATNNNPQVMSNSQFVPKGSMSSTNQGLRGVNANNPLSAHGAQVHNIHIKPTSANKRRAPQGNHQNLIQAQAQHQPLHSSTTYVSVPNILNSRGQKERSQTNLHNSSNTNSAGDLGQNKSQNQLISQYLSQVNHTNSQQQSNTNQSMSHAAAAYASRSTRNTASGKQSTGISSVSRAQRAYNNLQPSKTQQLPGVNSMSQVQQVSGLLPSSNRQQHNNSAYGQNNSTQMKTSNSQNNSRTNVSAQEVNEANGFKSRNAASNSLPKWQSLSSHQINRESNNQSATQIQIQQKNKKSSNNLNK